MRRWFERLAAGDPAPEMCDPEIEIRNWAEAPIPGPYHGYEGLRLWWRRIHDSDITSEAHMFDLQELRELDAGRVLTLQRASIRSRSGIELDRLWGSIITVRDGKILSAVGYSTAEAALEAAGPADTDG